MRHLGKTAIVTGASMGIGRAIAGRLAAEGARVILCARTGSLLEEAALEMGGFAVALDLRETDAPGRLAEFALEKTGRIDIVVNNAGATKRGAFLELADEDFTDGFALKYFAAVRLARASWGALAAAGGSLVNIAGTGGRTPGAEFAVGGSVNAALLSLTKALAAVGIAEGIQVNAVNPGTVRTGRFAKRLEYVAAECGVGLEEAEKIFVKRAGVTRVGEPEDIAALVAFLTSSEGRFLHGSCVDMDGGATKTL